MSYPATACLRAAAALGLLAATTGALRAEPAGRNCAPRDSVVARLNQTYGESRQAIALAGENQVVEIFASKDTGTWTITVTTPGGPTCMIAAGLAYEALVEALPNVDPRA